MVTYLFLWSFHAALGELQWRWFGLTTLLSYSTWVNLFLSNLRTHEEAQTQMRMNVAACKDLRADRGKRILLQFVLYLMVTSTSNKILSEQIILCRTWCQNCPSGLYQPNLFWGRFVAQGHQRYYLAVPKGKRMVAMASSSGFTVLGTESLAR
jgi:hypothetical protein